MADILEFGVKLNVGEGALKAKSDLSKAVKQIGKDLAISLDFDVSKESIEKLKKALDDLSAKHIDVITPEQLTTINVLTEKLSSLIPLLDRVEQAATRQSADVEKNYLATLRAGKLEEELAKKKALTARAEAEKTKAIAQSEASIARQLIAEQKLDDFAKNLPSQESRDLAIALGESLELAQKLTEVSADLKPFDVVEYYTKIANQFAETDISKYFEDASGKAVEYKTALIATTDTIDRAERVQRSLAKALSEGSVNSQQYDELYNKIERGAETARTAQNMLAKSNRDTAKSIEVVNAYIDIGQVHEWSDEIITSAKNLATAKDNLAAYQKELAQLESQFSKLKDTDEYIDRQADLEAIIAVTKKEIKTYNDELSRQISATKTLNTELDNEEGSYNQISARLEQLIKLRRRYNQENPKYKEITQEITQLEPQLDALNRIQGKNALNSRIWGREVVDLTYAIRLFNPTAGILVQRFQRISVLGVLWNKVLFNLTNRFNGNRTAALALAGSLAGVIAGLGIGTIVAIDRYIKKQRELQESINKTRREAEELAQSFRTAFKDVEGTISLGFGDSASLAQVKDAYDEIYKIVSKNEELLPLVKERLNAITDERERLEEIKKIYDEIIDITVSQGRQPNLIASLADNISIGFKGFESLVSNANEYVNKLFVTAQKLAGEGIISNEFINNISRAIDNTDNLSDTIKILQEELDGMIKNGSVAENKVLGLTYRFGQARAGAVQLGEGIDIVTGRLQEYYRTFEGQQVDLFADNFGINPESAKGLRLEILNWFRTYFLGLPEELSPFIPDLSKMFASKLGIKEISTSYQALTASLKDWQKILVKNNLYSAEQVKAFASIGDVTEDLAKKLDDAESEYQRLSDTIAGAGLIASDDLLKQLEATENLIKRIKEAQAEIGTAPPKTTVGAQERNQQLLAEINVIREAQKQYEKLREVYSPSDAARQVNKLYGELISAFTKLPNTIKLEFDGSDAVRAAQWAIDNVQSLAQEQTIKLGIEVAEDDIRIARESIQATINEMNNAIAKQALANKTYKDLLSAGLSAEEASAAVLRTVGKSVDNIRKSLVKTIAEASMSELFKGNVDLLSRPFVDAAELVKKGWEDAGEGIATVFSSQYGILDQEGKVVEVLVTPILPDGTVLSQNELEDYLHNTIEGAVDALEADTKGIIITVGAQEDGSLGEVLHDIQAAFYEFQESFDYVALEKAISLSDIPKLQKQSITALIKQLSEYDIATLKDIDNQLSRFKTFEEQKSDIVRVAEETRAKIREQYSGDERESRLAASRKKQAKDIDKLIYDSFKNTKLYTAAFDDLGKVSTTALRRLKSELSRLRGSLNDLDPTQVREIQRALKNVDDQLVSRNPFEALIEGIKKLSASTTSLREARRNADEALANLSGAEDELRRLDAEVKAQEQIIAGLKEQKAEIEVIIQAEERLLEILKEQAEVRGDVESLSEEYEEAVEAANELQATHEKIAASVSEISKEISKWAGLGRDALAAFKDVAELFGGMSEETKEIVQGIGQIIDGLEQSAEGAANLAVGIATGDPFSIISGSINLIGGLAKTVGGFIDVFDKRTRRANKEIKKQQDIIDGLTKSYARLERQMSKAIGTDQVTTARQQIENQQAQIEAIDKQIAAERSKKAKKQNAEFIAELEQAKQAAQDEIEDLGNTITESILGSGVMDLASQFSQAWADAYFSLESTSDAIADEFKQLGRRIAQNLILTKLFDSIVGDILDDVENIVNKDGTIDDNEVARFFNRLEEGLDQFDKAATAALSNPIWDQFLDQPTTALEGLSKSLQSLTEDTALALAGDIGNINFYGVARWKELVAIRELMEANMGSYSRTADYQDAMLQDMMLIRDNTASIAESNAAILSLLSNATEVKSGRGVVVKVT